MIKKCKTGYIITLILILILVVLVSVSLGSTQIGAVSNETYEIIIWKIRLPRICLAVLVGGALAVVGAVFQAMFANPLADPHILGVSSGAALGATIAMLTGVTFNILGIGAIGCFAFVGALVTVFVVYALAKVCGVDSIVNILLIGTAVSTMLSAVISILMVFNHDQIEKVYLWVMGSVSAATWLKNAFVVIVVTICMVIIMIHSRKINLLMMGEEDASCLGLDTDKIRKRLMVLCSVTVAATVSVSGIIGFVGLIIPHCVKMIVGSDHRRVLPYSFLCGSVFLVVCDTIARTIAAPTEIPVGIITSVCGAPFFIGLILKQKKHLK